MVLSQVFKAKEPFLEETVSQAEIGVKLPSSTMAHTQ